MFQENHTFIIAEIGLNHNGDYEIARQSVTRAAEIGCDAVKFQNFNTEDFIQDRSQLFTYRSQGREITEPFYDLCKRNEFKREWLSPLKDLCDTLNIEFLSTPTSFEGIEDLRKLGCTYVKNGSDYLTHIPLIKAMADSGMTVILSTGMADLADIEAAIDALGDACPEKAALLHCTSAYPTPAEDVNLNKIPALAERFGLHVGFSDHTEGYVSAVQAVTLGARILEKHFTLDHNFEGPDHWFSSEPEEMAELVSQVRMAEQRLGSAEIRPAKIEYETRDEYRIGVVADGDLKAGQVLHREDIAFRKPCRGILPRDLEQYLGRSLINGVSRNQPLQPDDFE